jgi:hypothetical protein
MGEVECYTFQVDRPVHIGESGAHTDYSIPAPESFIQGLLLTFAAAVMRELGVCRWHAIIIDMKAFG